jgi:hypothetical protein
MSNADAGAYAAVPAGQFAEREKLSIGKCLRYSLCAVAF